MRLPRGGRWPVSGVLLVALSREELARAGDPYPELCVRLTVDGIAHDPSGRRPPERLELRLSPGQLTDLIAQGRAARAAQAAQARRDARVIEAAADVAVRDTCVDTGVLARIAEALPRYEPR
ncbi:hypothetical protein [Streptomyces specialis]|uniref:hypothetical protein n=1 Tax=Streptomyces specialis TaxID=498367 RepID=UPI00073F2F4A|nr:hypothetical protein [Streptomyces specialis]